MCCSFAATFLSLALSAQTCTYKKVRGLSVSLKLGDFCNFVVHIHSFLSLRESGHSRSLCGLLRACCNPRAVIAFAQCAGRWAGRLFSRYIALLTFSCDVLSAFSTSLQLDLAIIIDSSDSISDENAQMIATYVERLLENLPIGVDDTRCDLIPEPPALHLII